MADVDSWSMHVRSITGPAELQAAMRDFERNVERAVQMEQRAQQIPVKVSPLSAFWLGVMGPSDQWCLHGAEALC